MGTAQKSRGEDVESGNTAAASQAVMEKLMEKKRSFSKRFASAPAQPATPLPPRQVFVLCCILLNESLSVTFLFPFVPFMVSSFGVPDDKLGYYVGMVASSFLFAQFFSSLIWGHLSDKFGRRPILLVGLAAGIVCTLAFGFCRAIWSAVLVRALSGLLNGNVGVAKCYMNDITDETNQARGFSIISLMWGIGLMAGPLLGGALAEPAEWFDEVIYPQLHGFFQSYPYLLACIVVSLVSVVGAAVGFFFLPETKNLENRGKLGKGEVEVEMMENGSYEPQQDDPDVEFHPEFEDDYDESDTAPMKLNGSSSNGGKGTGKNIVKHGPTDSGAVFSHPPTVTCIACYCFLKMATIMVDEVFPVWARSSVEAGGLGLEASDISYPLAIGGLALMIFQLLGYYRLERIVGASWLFRLGCFIAAPLISYIPFSHYLFANAPRWVFWAVIVTIFTFRSFATSSAFTSITILINNSALPSKIGVVTGASQSLGSLLSALAPLTASSVFTFFQHLWHAFSL